MPEFDIKPLSTTTKDHRLFEEACRSKGGYVFKDASWWIPLIQKCLPDEARGLLFRAHEDRYDRSRRLLLSGGNIHGVYLMLFNQGKFREAEMYLKECLGGEPKEIIPVKPVETT